MSKAAQSHELTYDLIKRAVHGDQEAIEAYLLHYDAYINFLVSYDEVGPDGRIFLLYCGKYCRKSGVGQRGHRGRDVALLLPVPCGDGGGRLRCCRSVGNAAGEVSLSQNERLIFQKKKARKRAFFAGEPCLLGCSRVSSVTPNTRRISI